MFGPGTGLSGVGASFQPGTAQGQDPYDRPLNGSGVQQAIKILSLRLPRVTGAQGALAAAPLLHSQGGGGNPLIDRILERAWQKVMGGGPNFSNAPAVPVLPTNDDRYNKMPTDIRPQRYDAPSVGPFPPVRQAPSIDRVPRIVPGREPEPPQQDPVFETPLPPPLPPSPGPPDDPWADDLRGRGFPI